MSICPKNKSSKARRDKRRSEGFIFLHRYPLLTLRKAKYIIALCIYTVRAESYSDKPWGWSA